MTEKFENVPLHLRYNPENILGDDTDSLSYMRVPVDNFGLDLLSRMGYSEQRGIGKNSKNALKKPIQFIPRQERQGLGASITPAFLLPANKQNKNKDAKDLVAENGKSYNYIGDKLIERKTQPELNDEVNIYQGKHKGLFGIVVQIQDQDVVVELKNEQQITVPMAYTKWVAPVKANKNSSRSRSRSQQKSKSLSQESQQKQESSKKKLKWVLPEIKVQVVSKKFLKGAYYQIKGTIKDIVDRYSFIMVTEDGRLVENLKEKHIQTIVPKIGGKVKILKGIDQGRTGIVQVRDRENEKVVVQVDEDLNIFEGDWDQVSEYSLA